MEPSACAPVKYKYSRAGCTSWDAARRLIWLPKNQIHARMHPARGTIFHSGAIEKLLLKRVQSSA